MANSTWGFEEGIGRMNRLPALTASNMDKACRRSATFVRDQMKRTIRKGHPGWPRLSKLTIERKGSSKPLIDHGDMMNSIAAVQIPGGKNFVGVPRNAKTDDGAQMVNIVAVHEFGAEISAKRGKFLAIPITREATRLQKEYGGAGNIPGLFRPKGKFVLGVSDGGNFKAMFVLVEQVTIPPRPFVEPAIEDSRKPTAGRFAAALANALEDKRYVG